MISITLEINEIGKRKAKEKNHKTKMWSFERTMLAKLWANRPEKKKREKSQITKIRNERTDIITYLIEIKNTKEYYEQLYTNNLD